MRIHPAFAALLSCLLVLAPIDGAHAAAPGQDGAIAGPEKLAGLAGQRALALSASAASDLGRATREGLGPSCATSSLLLTDDPAAGTRLLQAASLKEKLDYLSRRIETAREALQSPDNKSRGLIGAVAGLQAEVGAVVDLWKLFQSDYTVASFKLENDPDWIAAHFLRGFGQCTGDAGRPCAYSSRFASRADVLVLSREADSLVLDATQLQAEAARLLGKSKQADEKALVAEATAIAEATRKLQAALLDGGSSGVAPVALLAPWLRAVSEGSCLARIIDVAPEGIVLTRETIFGKGGKVYLHASAQLASLVSTPDGAIDSSSCRQRALAATVRLRKLATDKPDPDAAPWSKGGISPTSTDCQQP